MTELCKAGLSLQVHAMIMSFGGMKVSDIPSEKYPEVMKAVVEMAASAGVELPKGEGDG